MIQVPDEIKALLHQDTCKKNIRIHFPNGERTDICNNLIVKDSASFTESLCSQDKLKFGLCESATFECEVVGVGNIKGAVIEVFCEVYCESNVTGAVWRNDLAAFVYPVPYGSFTVESCQRQADIIHRRIVAYGGTANLKRKNPIIEYIQNNPFSSAAYAPDIFSTMMMISGSKTKLADATFNALSWSNTSYDVVMGSYAPPGLTYMISVKCAAYTIDSSNENTLYYVGLPDILKSREEIVEDLLASVPDDVKNHLLNVPYEQKIYSCGIGLGLSVYGNRGILQDGQYVYPYQVAVYPQGLYPGVYVIVPYKLELSYRTPGQSVPTLITSSTYRNVSDITISSVDCTNYPQYSAYYPRDIVDTLNAGKYLFDTSVVDYVGMMSAATELCGCFGQMDHLNEFRILNIKEQFALLPSNTLYPATDLYPGSPTGGKLLPNDYQSCWYDDEYTKPFGAIVCEYKNNNDEDASYTLYLTGYDADSDQDTYLTYSVTDNAIIKLYSWTQQQIATICNEIASNIFGVTYMPVDLKGRGLPYVEAGDTFEVLTKSRDSITTIVLRRTLTGEQTLTDTYQSTGTEGRVV